MEEAPLGLTAHELLRELRFIKLSPRERKFVVHLREEFKRRHLTFGEESDLRKIYSRHSVAIAQLKEAELNARVSIAKESRGHRHVKEQITNASVVGAKRNQEELARLEAEISEMETAEKDLGF